MRYRLDVPHVPAIHASLLCDEVESIGLNSAPVAQACGRRRADLLLPNQRITAIDIFKALEVAGNIIGHYDFGIKYGRTIDSITSGRTTRAAFSAPNLEQAIQRIEYFTNGMPSVVSASSKVIDDQFRITLKTPWNGRILPLAMQRFFTEAHMSFVSKKLADFLGEHPKELVLRFPFPQPTHFASYRALNATVLFDAQETSISLPTSFAKAPNLQYVKCLSDQAMTSCHEELERYAASKRNLWQRKVERVLRNINVGQYPSLDEAASLLHTSARSLTRNLKREGTSFQMLIDATRFAQAKKFLRETNQSVESIAPQVGFSDASNFRRAFKKWSKLTPKQFRINAVGKH